MLVIVTGMEREARIVGRRGQVVIAGGGNSGLAAKIEAALARGGSALISAGICGGLAPGLALGTVVIGSEVVWQGTQLRTDDAWRNAMTSRIRSAVCGIIAGSNALLIDAAAKSALYRQTGAAAVDMESHICAEVAAAHRLPFAVLRIVSDAAEQSLPRAALGALDPDGTLRIGAVLRSVAAEPGQIPNLFRAGRNSERALAGLSRCLDLLGFGFACPYLG